MADIETEKVYITRDKLVTRFVAAHGAFNPIIQGTKCLSCCVLAGLRSGLGKFAVIRSDPSYDISPVRICQAEDSFLRRGGQDTRVTAYLPAAEESPDHESLEQDGGDADDKSTSQADSGTDLCAEGRLGETIEDEMLPARSESSKVYAEVG